VAGGVGLRLAPVTTARLDTYADEDELAACTDTGRPTGARQLS
jgi:hypothetical protein